MSDLLFGNLSARWRRLLRAGGYLEYEAPRAAADFSAATGLRFVGSGLSRAVFELAPSALAVPAVLKLPLSDQGMADNQAECRLWAETPERLQVWLAPVLDCAEDGSWLVMEKAEPLTHEQWERMWQSAAEDAMAVLGIGDYDSAEQWGRIGRDLVLVDYGARAPDEEGNPAQLPERLDLLNW